MLNLKDTMVVDALTGQIRTLQYAKSLNAASNKRLTATIVKIKKMLRNTPTNLTMAHRRVLDKKIREELVLLRKDLRIIIQAGSQEIGEIMTNREIRNLKRLIPGLDLEKPTKRETAKAVKNIGLAGMGNIRQATKGYVDSIYRNTTAAIRASAAGQLGSAELVRAFSGYGAGSVRAAARRGIETLSRTAATAASSAARTTFAQSNKNIISGVRWVATLDGRTSDTCANLDGQIFAVGTRVPPAHPNCRSTIVFELKNNKVMKGLIGSSRASLDGPVSSKLTFKGLLQTKIKSDHSWIRKSYPPGKAKLLLKNGADEITKFVDRDLKPLPLYKIER